MIVTIIIAIVTVKFSYKRMYSMLLFTLNETDLLYCNTIGVSAVANFIIANNAKIVFIFRSIISKKQITNYFLLIIIIHKTNL